MAGYEVRMYSIVRLAGEKMRTFHSIEDADGGSYPCEICDSGNMNYYCFSLGRSYAFCKYFRASSRAPNVLSFVCSA